MLLKMRYGDGKLPKISIITPVYCDISPKVDWLDEMIQSVISQTVADWEIILINDKSPLPLEKVMSKHGAETRLRWFENAENSGPAKTRNTAVALAESECILPLDADDVLANSEVLENMYDNWSMDQTKIIYGNLQMYTPIANSGIFQRGKVIQLGQYTFELAMNLKGIMPVTAMHSKACHFDSGGWKHELNEGLEDVEYWIAAGERGYCGQKINITTLLYRRQEESRAYKLKHVNQNFEVMQRKIKEMHRDIYAGRFPMSCCGKGQSQPIVNDPIAMSQSVKPVRIIPLKGYPENELEWVAYNGPRKGRFDVIARGPANLPSGYTIFGTGQVFQVHKRQRDVFVNKQRQGFAMNQPDPRNKGPEPEPQPAVEIITETPVFNDTEKSTIVRMDEIAAKSGLEADIQPMPEVIGQVFGSENAESVVPEMPTDYLLARNVSDLGFSESITRELRLHEWTVTKLADTTSDKLLALQGIGPKRANEIIAKAQELINST